MISLKKREVEAFCEALLDPKNMQPAGVREVAEKLGGFIGRHRQVAYLREVVSDNDSTRRVAEVADELHHLLTGQWVRP